MSVGKKLLKLYRYILRSTQTASGSQYIYFQLIHDNIKLDGFFKN